MLLINNFNFYYFLDSLGLFAPYLERACLLLSTPAVSRVPLIMWYLTPGKSLTLPPLIKTTLCSCKLWPSPGMYAITSISFVSLTLAIFLKAELGFLGVSVLTTRHTPLFWGADWFNTFLCNVLTPFWRAGAVDFFVETFLPFLQEKYGDDNIYIEFDEEKSVFISYKEYEAISKSIICPECFISNEEFSLIRDIDVWE